MHMHIQVLLNMCVEQWWFNTSTAIPFEAYLQFQCVFPALIILTRCNKILPTKRSCPLTMNTIVCVRLLPMLGLGMAHNPY